MTVYRSYPGAIDRPCTVCTAPPGELCVDRRSLAGARDKYTIRPHRARRKETNHGEE